MNLIAAAAEDWGIGHKGKLLAKIPEDMKYFREKTLGRIVVMGRKTLETFPGKKPLPDRINIVLSKTHEPGEEGGVIWVRGADGLFKELEKYSDEDVFVIGGGEIYSLLLPFCDRAYITRIKGTFPADTYIFDFEDAEDWFLSQKGEPRFYEGLEFSFDVYERTE